MSDAQLITPQVRPRGWAPWLLGFAAVAVGALVIASGVLWAKYGSAVFTEALLAGLAACF